LTKVQSVCFAPFEEQKTPSRIRISERHSACPTICFGESPFARRLATE